MRATDKQDTFMPQPPQILQSLLRAHLFIIADIGYVRNPMIANDEYKGHAADQIFIETLPDVGRIGADDNNPRHIAGYQCIDAVNEAPSSGKTRIRHNFDARLFDAFANKWNSSIVADDRRATYVILQARAFANRIAEMRDKELKNMLKKQRRERKALANRVLADRIQYDIDERGEFFINPTDNYPELLHKRCEYAYQYETRIYFPDIHLSHIFDRKSVAVSAFDKSEYRIDHMPMRMNITADVVRWKKKDE